MRMSPDTHRRLTQLSIKTVHDLTRLPEVAVVSQFGNEGRRLWQLATGAVVDPVVGRETPELIVSEVEFPNPIADLAILTNALDRLIERALRHPRRAGWRILEVGVRARQEHGASWIIRSTLKDPSADKDHIAAPLKARLASAPPTGAVDNLAVEFLTFVRGTNELQLFARDANSSARAGRRRALRAAVHEMKTRFRHSAMYRVVEVYPGSRIPERRYALIDYDP
jgi:nucleotidyltransferase/DNA polymerase involved in DNA repair